MNSQFSSQTTINLLNDSKYNEELDDDYVPPENVQSRKRRNPFASSGSTGRKRKSIGAAVLSDDDDDMMDDIAAEQEEQVDEEDLDAFFEAMKEESAVDTKKQLNDIDKAWADMNTGAASTTQSSGVKAAVEEQANIITVKDTVEFAGKKVEVTKCVKADSKERYELEAKQLDTKRQSNLTAVVNMLSGQTKINSVEKTRLDWEKSKEEEGDADVLALKAKDGYLAKQAFLHNVDYRVLDKELKHKRQAHKPQQQ